MWLVLDSILFSYIPQVMLQPFDCDGAEKNKHKFMIQSMVLDSANTANLEQIVMPIVAPFHLLNLVERCESS